MESVSLQSCNAASPRRLMFINRCLLPALLAAVVSVDCFALSPAGAESQTSSWVSSWTASPQAPRGVIPASFSNRTIRQIVHLSIGGNKVRVRLSNEFGAKPVLIGTASMAIAGGTSDIVAASLRPVTFGGSKSVIIPPGAPVVSDPVEFDVTALVATSQLRHSCNIPILGHFWAHRNARISRA
jgi:hypothetical protein